MSNKTNIISFKNHVNAPYITDYKNRRYVEPTPIEVKIVQGLAFAAVFIAVVLTACL